MEHEVLLVIIAVNQFFLWFSFIVIGKSSKYLRNEVLIKLYHPSKKEAKAGEIKAGNILYGNKVKYPYYIKLQDLQRHMFITGITGSGKSNFLQNFLIDYKKKYDTPILLAEFKGEYHYLQKFIPDLLILIVGKNFSINIFDPETANAEVHSERIFQIFRSGGLFEGVEYSPQMERVFVDILNRVCKDPEKRSWDKFYEEAKGYLKDILVKTGGDPTYKNSVSAVTNRIRRYSLGTLKHSFERKSGIEVREIFENDVLLDLSGIIKIGGEKEDDLFFLNMILKYLWDKNIQEGSREYSGIKHITIIEDAQYFAGQNTTKKSTISSYIEDIALLLRGTGECLISLATRPAISPEILANCGIFVSFQNHMQKDYLQDLLNFDDRSRKFLGMLAVGKCMIRVNSIGTPFLMETPLIEREWLSMKTITENNTRVIEEINRKKQLNVTSDTLFTVNESIIFCSYCGSEIKQNGEHCEACYNKSKGIT
ncbi:MAG: DUF87 domain-containing protein [Patescibacteria group bacterium]|nr:DUF87 domain-containing protein [Patescibacteria group bacterium]